ncbi:MAG: signal peptidase II, partial [Planctomycetota bacterium]|nr:signal peptidase II [Planctomycetota bacterium]
MTRKQRVYWLGLAAVIAWLDLWSKGLFEYPGDHAGPPLLQNELIENWLYFRTIWNVGGVWSTPIPGWILLTATALAVPLILTWIFYAPRADGVENAGKVLVLGGAVGNLYDRATYS